MLFRPNQIVYLTYPNTTIINQPAEYFQRRLRVRYVRDLVKSPLTPGEFFKRPLVRRSRFLLSALDLDRNQARQFYVGNSLEYWSASPLRIGLYQKQGSRPVEILSEAFYETRRDRIVLANVLRRWIQSNVEPYKIGIFADDLSIVGE